jgi:hypothetical protein
MRTVADQLSGVTAHLAHRIAKGQNVVYAGLCNGCRLRQ